MSKKVFKGDNVTWSSTKMFSKRKKNISGRSYTQKKAYADLSAYWYSKTF